MELSSERPSKNAINRAGKSLAKGNIQDKDRDEALCLINLWRKEHIDPLNQVMQMLGSVELRSAYSNYYMTGNDFVSWLEEILSPPKAKPT